MKLTKKEKAELRAGFMGPQRVADVAEDDGDEVLSKRGQKKSKVPKVKN